MALVSLALSAWRLALPQLQRERLPQLKPVDDQDEQRQRNGEVPHGALEPHGPPGRGGMRAGRERRREQSVRRERNADGRKRGGPQVVVPPEKRRRGDADGQRQPRPPPPLAPRRPHVRAPAADRDEDEQAEGERAPRCGHQPGAQAQAGQGRQPSRRARLGEPLRHFHIGRLGRLQVPRRFVNAADPVERHRGERIRRILIDHAAVPGEGRGRIPAHLAVLVPQPESGLRSDACRGPAFENRPRFVLGLLGTQLGIAIDDGSVAPVGFPVEIRVGVEFLDPQGRVARARMVGSVHQNSPVEGGGRRVVSRRFGPGPRAGGVGRRHSLTKAFRKASGNGGQEGACQRKECERLHSHSVTGRRRPVQMRGVPTGNGLQFVTLKAAYVDFMARTLTPQASAPADPQNVSSKESREGDEARQMREAWMASLDVSNREERFFGLDMQLKALDRFFNLDNQPITQTDSVISRDFSHEVRVVAVAAARIARQARALLREDSNAFTFRSYIEHRMLGDRVRDLFIEEQLRQSTPAESLFLLGESFQNIADVAQALTRLNTVSFPLFSSLGQMISRTISANRFFNPMAGDVFRPEIDRLRSPLVAELVRGIADQRLRKQVTITMLAFFRLLRYLEQIDVDADQRDEVQQAVLVFALIHSETRMLVQYLEKEIPELLAGAEDRPHAEDFQAAADSLAFQCTMEMRKVFQQVLREALSVTNTLKLRGTMAAGAGVLRNFFEQAIIVVVQVFAPQTAGRDVFPGFVSKREQSLRLREDLWVLNKLCDAVEQQILKDGLTAAEFGAAIAPLRQFLSYFQNLSFKFVRYSDHDELERFFMVAQSLTDQTAENLGKLNDFRKKLNYFNRFVETTLGHVRHREELRDLPLDTEHAQRLLDQFLR